VDQLDPEGSLSADSVDASSPFVSADTTLRDALSMLLTSAVQTAVVVDERGRYAGVLTFDEIGLAFRSEPAAEPARVA
jgi:CBS domain containing-hemolysin-like protein